MIWVCMYSVLRNMYTNILFFRIQFVYLHVYTDIWFFFKKKKTKNEVNGILTGKP